MARKTTGRTKVETMIETRRRLEKEYAEKLRIEKHICDDQVRMERTKTLEAMSLVAKLIEAIRKDEDRREQSIVATTLEASAAVQRWAAH
jgi:hypothetical protein